MVTKDDVKYFITEAKKKASYNDAPSAQQLTQASLNAAKALESLSQAELQSAQTLRVLGKL